MDIGYINFSSEEQNNIYKVIQSIRDHQAIDELGIGRIRDAFSNRMFPGMSTLHNRAKYFVLLPSLYHQAEKEHYKNAGEVKQKILNLEIKLTRQLLLGTSDAKAKKGITGSSIIDQTEQNNSRYVKYDPSYIYWGALVSYNMVRTDGNLYQLIYERSLKAKDQPAKWRAKDEDEPIQGDDIEGSGSTALFDTGGLSFKFDGKTPISIILTNEEAAFIKRQIVTSEKVIAGQKCKDSLLAYILNHDDLPIVEDWHDNGMIWKSLPDNYKRLYLLSVRFSQFVYLLRVFYNHLYDCRTGNEKGGEKQFETFQSYRAEHLKDLTKRKIEEVLAEVNDFVNDNTVKSFCLSTADAIEHNDLTKLTNLLVQREKATKGSTRAKLTNYKKYMGQARADAYFLSYRWDIVFCMLQEIRKEENDAH